MRARCSPWPSWPPGGCDRLRIDFNEDDEVSHWTRRFGLSSEVLKSAIDEVGDHAHDIDQYRLEQQSSGHSHAS
ncbi:DUF3606 domain-containing protein [Aquabacterium sp.]|uniref:DUF3606 domain-containing protein n=1 Tax=Aquabacterium sp. TaxID=1872578 RepID=UPI0019BE57D1|nr:DUF3606 domain-containing protein [Aquabacterium sp.]